MIGYKGLIWLALQSGHVESIDTSVVYQKEIELNMFGVRRGTNPGIDHEPIVVGDRGAPVAFYAVAHLKTGGKPFEVMSLSDIEAIRTRSEAGKSGPWVTDFVQMARKSCIRRLANYLPLSEERFAVALKQDRHMEDGGEGDFTDILDVLPAKALDVPAEGTAPALASTNGSTAVPVPADRGAALAEQLKGAPAKA